ncbi:uncharacterized protein LOC126672602 [Mercurialis annua]|uniref:uncharacterized protein LOC126672602 n=1 Tax=Mercurialis annua TaxID=3986 RepID=UPI002160892E|nr:uncharacterized protein LOC126672602 [Mercurialis annua]
MEPIWKYLEEGKTPEDLNKAQRVRRMASRYVIYEGTLYQTAISHPWCRYVSRREGQFILSEFHEGTCDAHEGPAALIGKASLQGYYWPSMEEDSKELVKKYDKCPRHGDRSHIPA